MKRKRDPGSLTAALASICGCILPISETANEREYFQNALHRSAATPGGTTVPYSSFTCHNSVRKTPPFQRSDAPVTVT